MAKLEIGVLVHLAAAPRETFRKVAELGLRSCQLCSWDPQLWTSLVRDRVLAASEEFGVSISTFWAGYPGPKAWNFVEGPLTIGLVPRQYRCERAAVLKKASDFAKSLHLPSITTHAGFIPENPNNPDFTGTVKALRGIAARCLKNGMELWFESGQETPVTLLRTMECIGADNLGINLDPANLVMYGKANPVDALEVFGKFVRGVHAKDGLYPTDGTNIGIELPLGEGKVDFPTLIRRLKKLGYAGPLTIEREIGGAKQIRDIRKAIRLLKRLC